MKHLKQSLIRLVCVVMLVALLLPCVGVWASSGSPIIREYLNTGQDADSTNITGSAWVAQQFTTSALGHSVTSIRLYLKRVGDPSTITVSLREASSGNVTGLDLASGTYNGDTLGLTYSMVEFTIDEVSLEGGTQYAIVLRSLAGDATNYVVWGSDAGGGLANAVGLSSSDGGLLWSSDTPVDYLFEIWGSEVLDVKSAAVFSSYLEDDDLLFVADVLNEYPPYYPAYDSRAYFDLVLYNTDNTTVIASTPCVDWSRRAISLYISADTAAPLTLGSSYNLSLIGSFDPTNVIATYTLVSSDWKGSDLQYLDSWVITEAHLMEIYYDLTLVTQVGGVEVLNDAGGAEMDKGISGLSYIRPDIFQTLENIPTYTVPTYTDAFEGATDWDTQLGSDIVDTMDSIGTLFTIDGKIVMQSLFVIVMLGLGLLAHNFFFGLILALPVAMFATWTRVFPIQVMAILACIAVFLMIKEAWFSK